jgi:UTP-glucose-1-phosphate uridylyltransferase
MDLTLVVLAAGIGSRYGGLKQMDAVGPSGEFLIDYAIYDAVKAGFNRVVFVIRHDIESDFRKTVGTHAEKIVRTEYVCQELTSVLPAGFKVPADRAKPWGTGHAILVCEDAVKGPFGVTNADDFYGRASFGVLAEFLRQTSGDNLLYGMVGFVLRNTLSEHGPVARGVCRMDNSGNLETVTECTKIARTAEGITCDKEGLKLSGDEQVSLNMWGFKPSVFSFLRTEFGRFLGKSGKDLKAEFFVPDAIATLIGRREIAVKVVGAQGTWFGITHPGDRQAVVGRIRRLVESGEYPANLLSLH